MIPRNDSAPSPRFGIPRIFKSLWGDRTEPDFDDSFMRFAVCLFFLIFGGEKFSSDPHSEWVLMFEQIAASFWFPHFTDAGVWLRHFTGAVEVVSALLTLIPRTALLGLAMLAATMAGAAWIVVLVLHQAGASIFPGAIFMFLTVIGWLRWRSLHNDQ